MGAGLTLPGIFVIHPAIQHSRFGRAALAAFVAAACVVGAACAQSAAQSTPQSATQSEPQREPQRAPQPASKPLRRPDVPYEPSSQEVVNTMLRLGKVSSADVVYDLGCGDGRIVITAVRDLGARGVCVDIDPQRIAEARENARAAGVSDRIEFRNEDLFYTDIRDATAVMLFLWPSVNRALRPRLQRELKPGTRVVSHFHDMGDWKPEQTIRMKANDRERSIYLWTIQPH
jgi:SAM-dependent methyltransferase